MKLIHSIYQTVVEILHQKKYIGVKLIRGDILSVFLVICEKQEGLRLTVKFTVFQFPLWYNNHAIINSISITSTIWQYSFIFDNYQKHCKNMRNTEDNLAIKKNISTGPRF